MPSQAFRCPLLIFQWRSAPTSAPIPSSRRRGLIEAALSLAGFSLRLVVTLLQIVRKENENLLGPRWNSATMGVNQTEQFRRTSGASTQWCI